MITVLTVGCGIRHCARVCTSATHAIIHAVLFHTLDIVIPCATSKSKTVGIAHTNTLCTIFGHVFVFVSVAIAAIQPSYQWAGTERMKENSRPYPSMHVNWDHILAIDKHVHVQKCSPWIDPPKAWSLTSKQCVVAVIQVHSTRRVI